MRRVRNLLIFANVRFSVGVTLYSTELVLVYWQMWHPITTYVAAQNSKFMGHSTMYILMEILSFDVA